MRLYIVKTQYIFIYYTFMLNWNIYFFVFYLFRPTILPMVDTPPLLENQLLDSEPWYYYDRAILQLNPRHGLTIGELQRSEGL